MKSGYVKTLSIFLILILPLTLFGCDDDDDQSKDYGEEDDDVADDDDDDAADDDDDAGPPRSFYLAAAPFQFDVSGYNIQSVFRFDGFEGRVDLVSLHTDNFFGLPWDEFIANEDPPAPWIAHMQWTREELEYLDVGNYLSLTPISGLRNSIAAKAVEEDGETVVDEDWYTGCYNFDTGPDAQNIRKAFLRYVRWMVDYFDPAYLTHGIEINMYGDNCPADYDSLISLMNQAYEQEKQINPDLPIFPTITASAMWGIDDGECELGQRDCLIANLAKLDNLSRDRIGLSSYPAMQQWLWDWVPEDFYSAFAQETGEKVVIGEIGFNTYPVIVPYPTMDDDCFQVFDSSDEDQIRFMEFLFEDMQNLDSDLIVWWSLRDYLFEQILTSCPCDAPGLWCLLYNAMGDLGLLAAWIHWGSMGVLDYDQNPKASFAVWNDWYQRPVM